MTTEWVPLLPNIEAFSTVEKHPFFVIPTAMLHRHMHRAQTNSEHSDGDKEQSIISSFGQMSDDHFLSYFRPDILRPEEWRHDTIFELSRAIAYAPQRTIS